MKRAAVLIGLLALVGCEDGGRRCVASHDEIFLMPTYIGNTMYLLPQTITVCDRYEQQEPKR